MKPKVIFRYYDSYITCDGRTNYVAKPFNASKWFDFGDVHDWIHFKENFKVIIAVQSI